MKFLNLIIIFLLLNVIFANCTNNGKISAEEIEKRALKITKDFNSSNIELFMKWGYIPRGQTGLWTRNLGDSILYHCIYFPNVDSTELIVFGHDNFIKDYELNIKIDTSMHQISLILINNRLNKIKATNKHGKEVIIDSAIRQESIIKNKNPFVTFKKLEEIRKSHQIFGIKYYKRFGGLIEFIMSSEYILTYIPDITKIEPKYRQKWIEILSSGKEIRLHWNLRKLDKPIDLG